MCGAVMYLPDPRRERILQRRMPQWSAVVASVIAPTRNVAAIRRNCQMSRSSGNRETAASDLRTHRAWTESRLARGKGAASLSTEFDKQQVEISCRTKLADAIGRRLETGAMRAASGNRKSASPYTTGICRFPPRIATIHRRQPTS